MSEVNEPDDYLDDGINVPEGELSDAEPQIYFPSYTNKATANKHRKVDKQRNKMAPREMRSKETQIDMRGDGSIWSGGSLFVLVLIIGIGIGIHVYLVLSYNQLNEQLENLKLECGSSTIDYGKFAMKNEFDDVIKKFERKINDVNQTSKDNNHLTELSNTFNVKVTEFESQISSIGTKLSNIDEKLKGLPATEAKIETVSKQIEKVDAKLTGGIKELNDKNDNLQSKTNDMEETMKTHAKQSDMESFKNGINGRHSALETELRTLKTEDVETLKQKKKEIEDLLSDLQTAYESTKEQVDHVLLPNAFNKGSIMNALMIIMVVGCMLWIYNRYAGNRNKYQDVDERYVHNVARNQPEEAILYRRLDLKDSICAVRFSDNMQPLHAQILEAIFDEIPKKISGRCPRVFHNIGNHNDIENLPPVKLYILFVDYSERHIIIEEPGLGLGDFKRSTLQAINRIKGDAMIIYLKDPGSRTLPVNARYNPAIHVVKTQEALSTMNRQGRFYSVFDKLTDFQKQCIQAIITDIFRNRHS